MVTDPIADMITRIKNASMRGALTVSMPLSKQKKAVAEVLKNEGYILNAIVESTKEEKMLTLSLGYQDKKPRVQGVLRISKPSRRLYAGHRELQKYVQRRGMVVISTPKGISSGKAAERSGLGGEVLFRIW
jgi:small subunit ribosomal protein S8